MENLTFRSLFRESKNTAWKKQFPGPLSNNHGQILLTWLVVFSILILTTLSFGFAMMLIQDRQQMMTICRLGSVQAQSDAAPFLKQLLALNPIARALRVALLAAQAKLAIALAAQNIPAQIAALKEISDIRDRQRLLEKQQKTLIATANLKLQMGALKTFSDLQKAANEIRAKSQKWVNILIQFEYPRIPTLAMKEEDPMLAPAYVPREQFEKKQAMIQSWSQTYIIDGLLEHTHESKSECQATLEEETWIPKIRRDRPSLRWSL